MDMKIIQATRNIEDGKLVCFPTETVYALSANAYDCNAIENIYKIKGRSFDKPLALLLENSASASGVVKINEAFIKLADAFCPGPITFILPKDENCKLPPHFNPGVDTVAVRIPRNDIALEILRNANCPVVATSANPSGKPEAVNARHIKDYFGDAIECVIDGGECDLKVASTIVDLCSDEIKILREGLITEEEVIKVLKA